MKFVCDSCRAQYMISDEKVGPAGVKVRCKKCSHVIVVKKLEEPVPAADDDRDSTQVMSNPMAAALAAGAAGGAGAGLDDEIGAAFDTMFSKKVDTSTEQSSVPDEEPGPGEGGEDYDRQSTRVFSLSDVEKLAKQTGQDFDLDSSVVARRPEPVDEAPGGVAAEWYVAINDEQVGPLALDVVKSKWDGSEIGPDTLCWRPGLPDWRPLSQVAELTAQLAPRPAPRQSFASPGGTASYSAPEPAPSMAAAAPQAPSREPLPWERPAGQSAGASEEAAQAPDDDVDWKPSAASALASLVEQEMEAARKADEKKPASPRAAAGPPREEPVAPADSTGIRSLLSDLPEPPPQENSRIIPLPPGERGGGHVPDQRPRVEMQSKVSYRKQKDEGGSGAGKWIALGGVAVVLLVGGVVGVLFATGLLRGPKAAASGEGASLAAAGDPGGGKAPPPKAGEPATKPPEKDEPVAGAAKVDEPAKGATSAAVPVKDEPKKDEPVKDEPVKDEPARVADAGAAKRSHRLGGGNTAAASARPDRGTPKREDPPTPPPRKDEGKSDIDSLFDTEFSDSGSSRKDAGGKKKDVGYIPPAPGGGASKPASLGQGEIMGVVVAHKGAIKGCVQKFKASGGGSGTLVMAWTIKQNGRTASVKAKGSDYPALSSCIGGLIKGWTFPQYSGATMSPIEFPFNF